MITLLKKREISKNPDTGVIVDCLITLQIVHDDYLGIDSSLVTGYISGNPTTFTSPSHGLAEKDFAGIEEMTPDLPGQFRVLSVIDQDTFTADIDTTGNDYVSGGELYRAETSDHGYRLSEIELNALNATPLDGQEDVIKTIAAQQADNIIAAIRAQEQAAANKIEDDTETNITGMLSIAIALIVSAIIGYMVFHGLIAKARRTLHEYHCTDPQTTYEKAQQLLKAGATYLDANNNGIACDTLQNHGGTK